MPSTLPAPLLCDPPLQPSLPQVSPQLPHWCSLFMRGGGQKVPSHLRLVGSCRESLGRGDAEERQLVGSRTAHGPSFTSFGVRIWLHKQSHI